MANKTVWDLALEIAGKDKGASEAVRRVTKSINDAKKAMGDAKKAWGDFGKSAGKLALGVAAGVAAAGAGVLKLAGDFAAAGDQAAKTADALGMSIEGYQKLKFAMGDSGVEAAEFDGALQKMSNTIKLGAAGNKAAAGQLEAIGLSAAKLNKMRPEEAFERISDYMATLPNDAKRTEMAIQLFGKTAGPKMAAAMKMGSKGIQALGKEAEGLGIIMSTEQARASEEYNNQLSRMKLSVQGVKNQFIGGAIGPITEAFRTLTGSIKDQMPAIQELGAKFGVWLGQAIQKLPEIIAKIKEVAQSIWDGITKVKDFVGGWKNLAITIGVLMSLKTAILGVKAIMSTVIAVKKAWTLATTIWNGVTSSTIAISLAQKAAFVASKIAMVAGSVATNIAAAAQWAFNAAMTANPIGLIIIGVIALIAAIVLLVKNWDTVVAALKKAFSAIGNFFVMIWEGIKSFFVKVVDFVKRNALNILNVILGILFFPAGVIMAVVRLIIKHWDKIKEALLSVWEGIKAVFGKVKDFIGGVFNKVKEGAGKAWEGIKSGAGTAWEGIKNGAENLKNGTIQTFNKLKDGAGAAFNKAKELGGAAWEGIKGGAAKAGNFLKNNWKTVALGMVNPWAGGLKLLYDKNEKFRNLVDNSFEKIKNTAGKVWDKMPNGMKNVITNVFNKVKGLIDGIKQFFTGLWGAIKQGPAATFAYLKNAFFDLINKLKEGLEKFKNIAASVWEGIKKIIIGVIDNIKSIISAFKDFFTGLFSALKDGPTATIEYLREKFFRMFEAIKEKLTAFVDFFKNKIASVKDFFGGIGDKIGGTFSTVKNKITGHADGGIFTHRHIAEIAEKGAEAVVPLNKSPQGYDIWKQAGEIGGYMQKASTQTETSGRPAQQPAAMAVATQQISGGDTVVRIDFKMTNNFNGGNPGKESVNQITEAGQKAGDDFEARVKSVFESIMRNSRRISYA